MSVDEERLGRFLGEEVYPRIAERVRDGLDEALLYQALELALVIGKTHPDVVRDNIFSKERNAYRKLELMYREVFSRIIGPEMVDMLEHLTDAIMASRASNMKPVWLTSTQAANYLAEISGCDVRQCWRKIKGIKEGTVFDIEAITRKEGDQERWFFDRETLTVLGGKMHEKRVKSMN